MQIARGVFSEIRSKKSKDVGAKKQRLTILSATKVSPLISCRKHNTKYEIRNTKYKIKLSIEAEIEKPEKGAQGDGW